jgi:hypothetical protein
MRAGAFGREEKDGQLLCVAAEDSLGTGVIRIEVRR